jgi:hypothetical protein
MSQASSPSTAAYRSGESDSLESEVAAYYDLLGRIRRLQTAAVLGPVVVGFCAGVVGVVAHVTGRWVLVPVGDGMEVIAWWTLLFALVAPAFPIVLLGYVAYRVMRPFVIRRWHDDSARTYGLSSEALDRRAKQLP